MKKILSLLMMITVALTVKATDYTDRILVLVNGVGTEQTATITVSEHEGVYDLNLKNFVLMNGDQPMPVGNVELTNITPETSGNAIFLRASQDITIAEGDLEDVLFWLGPSLGELPVEVTAVVEGDKLRALINLDLMDMMGQLIDVKFGDELVTGKNYHVPNGNFEEPLPKSQRMDSVGRLTNSFIQMQHSLAESVWDIRKVNAELELHNEELAHAYKIKMDANERKTAFTQNMFHHIRTPLNIISGFTQVLSASIQDLSEEEISDITFRMMSSAKAISHISKTLTTSSGLNNLVGEATTFCCNELCREATLSVKLNAPDAVELKVESELPDTFTIHTNREALLSILEELLDNANKFTHEESITIGCRQNDADIIISVSNTGASIPVEARDRIFVAFTKLDSFTEGIGLGLSLSRHIARQLGGRTIAESSYRTPTWW